jgi:hypothetical protein
MTVLILFCFSHRSQTNTQLCRALNLIKTFYSKAVELILNSIESSGRYDCHFIINVVEELFLRSVL